MTANFTVQDGHGIYQFEGVGEALACLLADAGVPASLYGLTGLTAKMNADGTLAVFQPMPVLLTYQGKPDDPWAVIVDSKGVVTGAPLGEVPVTEYLNYGWTVS